MSDMKFRHVLGLVGIAVFASSPLVWIFHDGYAALIIMSAGIVMLNVASLMVPSDK